MDFLLFWWQDAVFFLPHGDRKTLTERALAAAMGASAHVYIDTVYLPRIQRIVQKTAVEVLGKRAAASIPPVGQIESKRTALVLVNWHWSFGSFVRPNPPNIVEVATMHCKEPQKIDKVKITIFNIINSNIKMTCNISLQSEKKLCLGFSLLRYN